MSVSPRAAGIPAAAGGSVVVDRLHLLLTGTMRQAASFDAREAPGARVTDNGWPFNPSEVVRVPIVAFVAEHPEAGPILVDTGLHSSVADKPRRNLGRIGKFFMEPEMSTGQAARDQLVDRGIDPDDVALVVMTHLHVDHASAIAEFPDATFVADALEWESALRSDDDPAYHRPQFNLPFDWRLVDFHDAVVRPAFGFRRTIDLLGDGSLLLLSTPGHSLGHLSVLVRLRDRHVLLAGDAAFTRRSIEQNTVPMYVADEAAFRESLAAIRALADDLPELIIVPGHDADAWRELADVYS